MLQSLDKIWHIKEQEVYLGPHHCGSTSIWQQVSQHLAIISLNNWLRYHIIPGWPHQEILLENRQGASPLLETLGKVWSRGMCWCWIFHLQVYKVDTTASVGDARPVFFGQGDLATNSRCPFLSHHAFTLSSSRVESSWCTTSLLPLRETMGWIINNGMIVPVLTSLTSVHSCIQLITCGCTTGCRMEWTIVCARRKSCFAQQHASAAWVTLFVGISVHDWTEALVCFSVVRRPLVFKVSCS